MNKKLRISIIVLCIVLLVSAFAFADQVCKFTFTANGRTYHVTHNPSDFEWYMMPNEGQPKHDVLNPSKEYIEFYNAYQAALNHHRATCPYQHNLGDARVPMPLLYGGAVLALAAIILVYSLRKKHRRLPAVKSSYAQSR